MFAICTEMIVIDTAKVPLVGVVISRLQHDFQRRYLGSFVLRQRWKTCAKEPIDTCQEPTHFVSKQRIVYMYEKVYMMRVCYVCNRVTSMKY